MTSWAKLVAPVPAPDKVSSTDKAQPPSGTIQDAATGTATKTTPSMERGAKGSNSSIGGASASKGGAARPPSAAKTSTQQPQGKPLQTPTAQNEHGVTLPAAPVPVANGASALAKSTGLSFGSFAQASTAGGVSTSSNAPSPTSQAAAATTAAPQSAKPAALSINASSPQLHQPTAAGNKPFFDSIARTQSAPPKIDEQGQLLGSKKVFTESKPGVPVIPAPRSSNSGPGAQPSRPPYPYQGAPYQQQHPQQYGSYNPQYTQQGQQYPPSGPGGYPSRPYNQQRASYPRSDVKPPMNNNSAATISPSPTTGSPSRPMSGPPPPQPQHPHFQQQQQFGGPGGIQMYAGYGQWDGYGMQPMAYGGYPGYGAPNAGIPSYYPGSSGAPSRPPMTGGLPSGIPGQKPPLSGSIALPRSSGAPSAAITPKKSSAIRIMNPVTKEEVNLKSVAASTVAKEKDLSPITASALASAAEDKKVAESTGATATTTTVEMKPIVLASAPPRSAALKIVDPNKHEEVDISAFLKKEADAKAEAKKAREAAEKAAATSAPLAVAAVPATPAPVVPDLVTEKAVPSLAVKEDPKPVVLPAVAPPKDLAKPPGLSTVHKPAGSPDIVVKIGSAKSDAPSVFTPISHASQVSSPLMDHDSSLASSNVSEAEDGEIFEEERIYTVLKANKDIKYPDSLKDCTPDVSAPFKKYSKEFLMAFAELNIPGLNGIPSMSELRGDDHKSSRSSQDRGKSTFGGRSMQRGPSDYGKGDRDRGSDRDRDWERDRYSGDVRDSRGGRGGSRRSQGVGMARQNSGEGSRFGRSGMGGRSSRRSERDIPPPPPSEPVEPLARTENAWMPHGHKKGDDDVLEKIERLVKGLLNKLTIERFDTISDQILKCGITNIEILITVISIIFEKAIDEPNFGSMYALLCSKLSAQLPQVQEWIEGDAKSNTFRRALLNKCQQEFSQNAKWSAEDDSSLAERQAKRKILESLSPEEKLKIAEEDYERSKLKRRVLGNIRFIGELFIKGMITEKIMHSCVTQLLTNSEPEEEDVESLCKLMTTIGSRLDHEKARGHLDNYFTRIREISVNKKLSSRIRFMLLDLIDLRKNGWKARVEVTGPKTIAEITAIAERKLAEEAAEKLRLSHGGSRTSGRGDRSDRGGRDSRDRSGRDRRDDRDDYRSSRGSQDARGAQDARESFSKPINIQLNRGSVPQSFGPPGKTFSGAQKPSQASDVSLSTNAFDVLRDAEAKVSEESHEEVKPTLLTAAQAKTKIDAVVAEWWSVCEKKEVKLSLEELETNEYNVQFIESLLNALFDRKVEDFKKSADLINYLFKEGVFTLEDITKGLELQVAEIESNAIDAPNLYKHMGILLGKLILEGVLNLSILPRIFSGIIKSRSLVPPAPKLLGELLSGIRTEEGDDALVDAVQAEPIKYELFWSPDSFNEKVLADWMEKYSLAVLSLSAGDEEPVDLEAKIKELNGNGQELAEWIDANVSESVRKTRDFVFQLAMSYLQHMASKTLIPDGDGQFKDLKSEMHKPMKDILLDADLLKNSVMHEKAELSLELQVAVLQATEAVWENTGKMNEFMVTTLRILFDEDIVSKEANLQWKEKMSKENARKLVGWFRVVNSD